MTTEQIEREIVVNAPVERVWAVLTDSAHIGGWFGDGGNDVDLRPGGAAVFRWRRDGEFHATIERVEPYQRLSYRWACRAGELPRAGNSTLVEFTLRPDGDGTRLRVVESGFNTLDVPEDEQIRNAAMNTQGWHDELAELRDYAQALAA